MTAGDLLPEQIEAALVELTDLGFELTRLAAAMEEREDLHLCAILNARDESNKPTYSNEDRRLIEFRQASLKLPIWVTNNHITDRLNVAA
jgi:hypothetical protein